MTTLNDFTNKELAIATNLIQDCAVEIQQQIHATEKFFIDAGADVPDQSWRAEQVDILTRLMAMLTNHMVEVKMNEIIKSN